MFADGGKGGEFRDRSCGPGADRIALGIPERMATANGQDPDSRVYSVGRNDAEYVPTGPNLAQHVIHLALIASENPHPTACLAHCRPTSRSR